MQATHSLKPGIEPALELIERVMRDGRPLADECPLVFREEFEGRVLQLADGERVHATLAILPRTLVTVRGPVRVAMIGSVCTDPASRERGLATQLLAAAEKAAADMGCMATLLWSDEPAFYVRRGYRTIGTEVDIALPKNLIGRLPVTQARAYRSADAAALHELYQQHPVRCERTLEEMQALLECPGMELVVAERDGVPVAYAARGRGEDLTHYIHEWAGSADEVLGLMRHLAESWYQSAASHENNLMTLSPDQPLDVTQRLCDLGFPSARGFLGLAKLLDARGARNLLASAAGQDGKTLATLTPRDLLDCLFPPKSESQTALEASRWLGCEPEALPCFGFTWGLDSI